MRSVLTSGFVLLLIITVTVPEMFPQRGDDSFPRPEIEISDYIIETTLALETHEIESAVTITFQPRKETDYIVFDINENLWIRKVLDVDGVELDFEQGALGPGILSVSFAESLNAFADVTIRITYRGGFDRDRFSRMYSRDESSAYIGEEGSYLMYGAKWIPAHRFLANRTEIRIEVTVPLGITVIGPGKLESVITKGINETFIWKTDAPTLPASIVAGRYFRREVTSNGFTLECFTRDENADSVVQLAEMAASIMAYYQDTYGPSASGKQYRLVEVDGRLDQQHGMLGTVFITSRELEQPSTSELTLARRIAYQWWRETMGVQDSSNLWLEDGMAYYSAAGYLGNSQGEDAFNKEINALAILALKFENVASVRSGFDLGYRTERYESVVAGKGAWVLHMLRGLMGDSKFNDLIQMYIQSGGSGNGSMVLIQSLAEKLYGEPLDWFFAEWVETTGIPSLQSDYVVYKTLDGFRVIGAINQDRDLFRMPLEVSIIGTDEENLEKIQLNGRSTSFDISAFSKPIKIALDPNKKLLQNSASLQTSVQMALGDDRKEQGDFVGAIRAYESALKLSPQKSFAHFSMAEVYYEQFNLQSAADSFRNALNGELEPKWIEVWSYIYLGKIYDILGQRSRAMAEYTKAINTKDDTEGAQVEAKKWIEAPFTRKRTILGE